jgi:hypothetical protein
VFITHFLVVASRVELSEHDAAEGYQRSLTLFVRQQTPELVQRHQLSDGRPTGER